MSVVAGSVAPMDVLLVPGFWLDTSSWEPVVHALTAAGHRPRPLTLPGMASRDADRTGITLADHVAATVRAIDESGDEPVVLVGHSGGSHVVWGAADARPERVARIVYVDGFPVPDGTPVNPDLPVVGDEVPVPDWSVFDDGSLTDLTEDLRAEIERVGVPMPVGVATEPLRLTDVRRRDIPQTLVVTSISSAQVREMIDADAPFVSELAACRDIEIVDLPTGHWPQLTRPQELADVVAAAVDR